MNPRFKQPLLLDERGVSAVEFALCAPVLILLLLGISDVAPALMARYHVNHMTESVGDLTAEYSEVQPTEMANIFSAASDLLAPLSTTTLALRLTSVYSDGKGHAYVHWSCGQGALGPYAANSAVTSTPTGTAVNSILWENNTTSGGYTENGANTTYVMAESQYTYKTLVQYVIKAPMVFTNAAYFYPRQSTYVGFPWDGVSSDTPPTPTTTTRTASVTLSNGAICNYIY